LLKDVLQNFKFQPKNRSEELFTNYAGNLETKATSLSEVKEQESFYQKYIQAMESTRHEDIDEDDFSSGVLSKVPIFMKAEEKTKNETNIIDKRYVTPELVTFPRVNDNKFNLMLDRPEELNMTLTVENLPNEDADLEEEQGDSKIDPYYMLKGIDMSGESHLLLDGEKEYVKQQNSATWTFPLKGMDKLFTPETKPDLVDVVDAASAEQSKLSYLLIEIHNKNFCSKNTLVGTAKVNNIATQLVQAKNQRQAKIDSQFMKLKFVKSEESEVEAQGELSFKLQYGDPDMADTVRISVDDTFKALGSEQTDESTDECEFKL